LLKQFPALAAHRASVRLARNWEYAAPDVRFANTDEVALLPPVSGG
jgi:molybdopterin converting factor small subunit